MTMYNQSTLKGIFRKVSMMMFFALSAFVMTSCSSDGQSTDNNSSQPQTETNENAGPSADDMEDAAASASANEGKGVGPFADKTVTLGATVDEAMAAKGKAIFESKCTACHKVTDEKYVGPGLKGVTERRKPEWIMNMIINPGEMIEKDPIAKELLAEHLTQMAKQDVNEQDVREILEYLRKNDMN